MIIIDVNNIWDLNFDCNDNYHKINIYINFTMNNKHYTYILNDDLSKLNIINNNTNNQENFNNILSITNYELKAMDHDNLIYDEILSSSVLQENTIKYNNKEYKIEIDRIYITIA